MRARVTHPRQVAANVAAFTRALSDSPGLQETVGHVHAWYALRGENGWMFGPSKFVGYPGNTPAEYLRTRRTVEDGRQTEKALTAWFSPVDPDSRLGRELAQALTAFLAAVGRAPRRGARISVVSTDPEGETARPATELLSRIVTDPEICGGRPSIRGTRMRVSDIVDMLAAGASHDEILDDYPYLAREDIAAALAYAARAADHRVIRAA
jgi:uncharacterized protein (DUF433 family)